MPFDSTLLPRANYARDKSLARRAFYFVGQEAGSTFPCLRHPPPPLYKEFGLWSHAGNTIYIYQLRTLGNRRRRNNDEGFLGPPRRTSTPGGHDLWRGRLITMRPSRIHKQISQILIQLSRLMAAGLWRRCGASDLSRGQRKEAEEPLPTAPTLSSSPREITITAGISVAIGIVIILLLLLILLLAQEEEEEEEGRGNNARGHTGRNPGSEPNVSTTESLIYSRSTSRD